MFVKNVRNIHLIENSQLWRHIEWKALWNFGVQWMFGILQKKCTEKIDLSVSFQSNFYLVSRLSWSSAHLI